MNEKCVQGCTCVPWGCPFCVNSIGYVKYTKRISPDIYVCGLDGGAGKNSRHCTLCDAGDFFSWDILCIQDIIVSLLVFLLSQEKLSIFQSSLTRLMKRYLALMLPCDMRGWYWGVLDQASNVDGAPCVQIDFAFTQDCGYWNCNAEDKEASVNGFVRQQIVIFFVRLKDLWW